MSLTPGQGQEEKRQQRGAGGRAGGRAVGRGGRAGQQNPYDNVPISDALPNIVQSGQAALGNLSDIPTGPDGTPLLDSVNNVMDTNRQLGSGRRKEHFRTGEDGTTRIPLTGDAYGAVVGQLAFKPGSAIPGSAGGKYPSSFPQGEQLFVAADNRSGSFGDAPLGSDQHQQAIAAGDDRGIGYIRSSGNASVRVGGPGFVQALRTNKWSPEETARNVAFAMFLGGPLQARNLWEAGYRPQLTQNGWTGSQGGSGLRVKALAAKRGVARRTGQFGFALRAAQQSRYWENGRDDPVGFGQQLVSAQNRDDQGFARPGSFPVDTAETERLKRMGMGPKRGRGYRTGMQFVPRTADGMPLNPGGDMYDANYQCKVENSGPGISDFIDENGQPQAGFRLFKRRNKKAGTVSCTYSPDIFVNTLTASYLPPAGDASQSRVMTGNTLRQELQKRGQGALGDRLDRDYAYLQENRDQFFNRSLKQRGDSISDTASAVNPQAKVAAWSQRGGGFYGETGEGMPSGLRRGSSLRGGMRGSSAMQGVQEGRLSRLGSRSGLGSELGLSEFPAAFGEGM